MSRKIVISIFILLMVMFPASSAFKGHLSAEYSYYFPQNAHVADARFDALWGSHDDVSAGVMVSMGYGVEHFTRFGSNALITGPEISLGPEISFRINESLSAIVSVQICGAYPLYPTVLRAKADADIRLSLSESLYAGLGAGVLYPDWCASVSLSCGVLL
ncbi:MAG: hypothetical protein ILP16_10590 [Spirochaetales bacterium]|nr:hypothetical protein [Spirochaetales bacterium]